MRKLVLRYNGGEKIQEETRAIIRKNIRRLRDRAKMTQRDAAYPMGLDSSYISALETGGRNLSLEGLAILCDVLKCEMYELFMK